MNAGERWQRVRELFERAFEEKPADVPAWLDRNGVDDWQLREEVLSLIQHHAGAGSFLDNPAGHRLAEFIADDHPLEPGQVLGQYRILRDIGSGGQGRIYLANDERLGRRVALKALSPDLTADPSHRERLRREASAAAALSHPGICTVYALEEFDGELYIASEFVDGHTLRAEIKQQRPTADEVVSLAGQLARALAHAHTSGITHRDLKPENVMRTRDGQLKIVDFGLARIETPAGDRDAFLTQPGAFMGTPAYMSPEQLNGQRADARADVWAFGVLLYEYASGAHPFEAPTAAARIRRIFDGAMDPIESRRSDLPASIVNVIGRSLSTSPSERYASAAEIVGDLDRAGPPSRPMTAWWRTHQFVVIALYFIACGLTWQIKEWQPGTASVLFFAVGIIATVAGIFRGHLLFAERVNSSRFGAELQRAVPVLFAADLSLAVALGIDGLLLAGIRPVASVLTVALGVGIALARLLVEPATTSASFKA
jgi:serine/threonine-protein kinase